MRIKALTFGLLSLLAGSVQGGSIHPAIGGGTYNSQNGGAYPTHPTSDPSNLALYERKLAAWERDPARFDRAASPSRWAASRQSPSAAATSPR